MTFIPDLPDGADGSDLARLFLGALPISGASITVMSGSGVPSSIGATDAVAARLEELQFELGEGPQWQAARSGLTVTLSDVASDDHLQWPIFGAAMGSLPVGALISVPMRMGAVTVGVAGLYRETEGDLSPDHQRSALAIASAIAGTAAKHALKSASVDVVSDSAVSPALRREVHQATGMILVQLGTTATDAYSRLQAFAFANERTLQDVAHDVVTRKISFNDPPR